MLAGSLSVSICHLHVHFHSLEGFRADEPERYVVYSQLNQISQSVTVSMVLWIYFYLFIYLFLSLHILVLQHISFLCGRNLYSFFRFISCTSSLVMYVSIFLFS